MKKQKKKYTIKALFLPMEVREALNVKDGEDVDILEENGHFILKNRLEHALEEINEMIEEDYAKIGVVTTEDSIQHAINFRHGNA